MEVRFVKIPPRLSTPKVGYFTIVLGSKPQTEFEEFTHKDFSSHQKELQLLYTQIKEVGLSGAKPYYFKNEGGFEYLPKLASIDIKEANNEDYGIRLYCFIVSPQIVVLLNGGIKTNLDPEKCPNVQDHFRRAKILANKLTKALHDKYITVQGTDLIIDEGFEIDI